MPNPTARLETSLGTIDVELFTDKMPITAGNFIKLAKAGFDGIDIEPTRVYSIEDARQFLTGEGIDVDAIAPRVKHKFMSAFIKAFKPSGQTVTQGMLWSGVL